MIKDILFGVIEFVIGFLLIPIFINLLSGALIAMLANINVASSVTQLIAYSQIGSYALRGIVLILLFKIRKIIAFGYLADLILEFVGIALPALLKVPLNQL